MNNIRAMLVDMNIEEIGSQISQNNLESWLKSWKKEVLNAIDKIENRTDFDYNKCRADFIEELKNAILDMPSHVSIEGEKYYSDEQLYNMVIGFEK